MPATLAKAQTRVEHTLGEGLPLEQIEAWIEERDLTHEANSARWPLAWIKTDRRGRRGVVGGAPRRDRSRPRSNSARL
jgi:hypothetical protein